MTEQSTTPTSEVASAVTAISAPASCTSPAPRARVTVECVRTGLELQQRLSDLEDLCANSLEPNVFYEPWMLLPAIHAYGSRYDLMFLLVWAHDAQTETNHLCGLFPFERRKKHHGLKARALMLWAYPDCALCTPVIRRGYQGACFEAAFDWAKHSPDGADVLLGINVRADGPIYSAMRSCVETRRMKMSDRKSVRALLVPRGSADEYLRAAINREHRHKVGQKKRNLAKLGTLELVAFDGNDLDTWLENFLALELRGWKGKLGCAARSHPESEAFVRTVLSNAWNRGRLYMLALNLDGRPVAMKCNLFAGEGGFAFKITYDEGLSRFSPGQLLEIDAIGKLHDSANRRWIDSCVSPAFAHISQFWMDERGLADICISSGSWWGDLLLALEPVTRKASEYLNRFRGTRKGSSVSGPTRS